VLDIGAWDGAFSFECERRGARRVVAADYFVWRNGGDKGFDYAYRALKSRVQKVNVRVEDLTTEKLGAFDLVLFLGVLYHSEDPLCYLRKMRAMCKGKAIIETNRCGRLLPTSDGVLSAGIAGERSHKLLGAEYRLC